MLGTRAASFLRTYPKRWESLKVAAALAEKYVSEALRPGNFDLHGITARAKAPESARAKILSKGYRNPAEQLTDQVGVRVITYFESDVDRIVADLRPFLDVDEAKSPDKRSELGLREFGYSSVHLVATIRASQIRLEFRSLTGQKLEIQIRSILEHAWAEIEHEVVYKAGIDFPEVITRRFSALAGTLELLQREFEALRAQRGQLIEDYAKRAADGQGLAEPLDAARLLGLLEVLRPDGLSWRQATQTGRPFPPRIEALCVRALKETGIDTSKKLRAWVESLSFQRVLSSYAALEGGQVPSQLSHLAVVVLAIASRDTMTAESFLPELAGTESVRSAVATRG